VVGFRCKLSSLVAFQVARHASAVEQCACVTTSLALLLAASLFVMVIVLVVVFVAVSEKGVPHHDAHGRQ